MAQGDQNLWRPIRSTCRWGQQVFLAGELVAPLQCLTRRLWAQKADQCHGRHAKASLWLCCSWKRWRRWRARSWWPRKRRDSRWEAGQADSRRAEDSGFGQGTRGSESHQCQTGRWRRDRGEVSAHDSECCWWRKASCLWRACWDYGCTKRAFEWKAAAAKWWCWSGDAWWPLARTAELASATGWCSTWWTCSTSRGWCCWWWWAAEA